MEKLKAARIAVFGIGGVGGYTVEALARAGVGELHLIDSDRVSKSNINRQIIATERTVGMYKTDAFEERIHEINPTCRVKKYNVFVTPENISDFDIPSFDYIVDAIDSVKGKASLAEACDRLSVPIVSAMGAGNKLDPTAFLVSDIYKTSVCPLARAMRTELKKRGVKKLKVVYSKEPPHAPGAEGMEKADCCRAPASISFVPSVMGLIIASEVVKDIIKTDK